MRFNRVTHELDAMLEIGIERPGLRHGLFDFQAELDEFDDALTPLVAVVERALNPVFEVVLHRDAEANRHRANVHGAGTYTLTCTQRVKDFWCDVHYAACNWYRSGLSTNCDKGRLVKWTKSRF